MQDYRPNIFGLLKRHSGVNGKLSPESTKVLDKIVDGYVALMSMADFVDVSDPIPQVSSNSTDFHSMKRQAPLMAG